jgi:predicted dehydrogenase
MTKKKTVLIVGVGSIGLRHLRCFQNTGRVNLSICENNAKLRSQVAAEYHIDQHYPDLDSALADPHDIAVIATPANLHIPMAIRLAEAGLHLLLEKPLSTGFEGIDTLQGILQKRNLVSVVAYVHRANPVLRAMKDAIASGRFGRPVEVVANCGQNFPTYRPAYRDTYYRNRATGGGAIQDALTHILNAAEWLVGPIDRLAADAAHQVLEGVEVEDTAHILTRHGQVLGCYSLNQHQAPNETTITVVCDQGTARFEFHQNRWRWMTRPEEPWHDEQFEALPRDALFINQANAFLDTVEGRVPPLCSLEEGIQTLRVNLAALAAVDQGAWQQVRPNPA